MWIYILVGILNLWMGYQLLYKKRYSLIAGYDPQRTKNPEPLARMLGALALGSGACFVLFGVGSSLFSTAAPWGKVGPIIPIGTLVALLLGLVKVNRELNRPKMPR